MSSKQDEIRRRIGRPECMSTQAFLNYLGVRIYAHDQPENAVLKIVYSVADRVINVPILRKRFCLPLSTEATGQ